MKQGTRKASATTGKSRMGGVFKNGRLYYARWRSEGIDYVVPTQKTTKAEALEILDKLTEPFRLKNAVETAKILAARAAAMEEHLPALQIADIWAEIEKSVKYCSWATETRKRNRTHITRFVEWMSDRYPEIKEVRGVVKAQAEEFIRFILDSCKSKTAIEYRACLLQAWEMTKNESKISGNVWKEVSRPVSNSHRRRVLTEEELRKIFARLTGEMRTLFAIGTYTGLRLGDAVTLNWADIDLDKGTIHKIPKKTERHGTEVVASIANSPLRRILAETPEEKRIGDVLPTLAAKYRATPTGNAGFGKLIKKVFTDCGIETNIKANKGRRSVDVGYHSLRHTFVSLSANAGVPLAVVQSIVGHTSTNMTQHYYHTDQGALDRAAQALPDFTTDSPTTEQNLSVEQDMKQALLEQLVANWSMDELKEGIMLLSQFRHEK